MPIIKKKMMASVGEDVEKLETSCIVGRIANKIHTALKTNLAVPQLS